MRDRCGNRCLVMFMVTVAVLIGSTAPARVLSDPEFKKILKKHKEWLESKGQSKKGEQANLSGVEFRSIDKIPTADLTRANLTGAYLAISTGFNGDGPRQPTILKKKSMKMGGEIPSILQFLVSKTAI